MSTGTAGNGFRRPQDRRARLRRASDRKLRERLAELTQLIRESGRCAEIDCGEPAWPGSDYCLWHPTLRLAGQKPDDRPRPTIRKTCTCCTV